MKKYFNLKNIVLVLTLILSITAACFILTNKVFKFAEFHDYYVVEFKGEDKAKVTEAMNTFSNDANAAKFIWSENKINFEKTNIQDLDKKIAANLKEGITYSTVINLSPKHEWQILNETLFSLILIGIVAFLSAFVFALRFNNNIKFKQYFQIFIIFGLSLGFGILLQLGIMSFISQYYQIRYLDLVSIYTMALFLSVICFLGIYHYKTKEGVSLISIADTLTDEAKKYAKKTIFISLVILALVSIGLGSNFVIHAVFIFISLIVALASIYFVGHVFKINIDEMRNDLKSKKVSTKQPKKAVKKAKVVKNSDNIPKKKVANAVKAVKKEKKKKDKKKPKPGRKTR